MDKYKLVPVEPTASPTSGMNLGQRIQHVGGWESERGTVEFGSVMAVGALVSHILRDIAVQGEPIGWYTEDHLDDKSATTYSAEVAQRWRDKGWPVWPLYTAPQPTEQVENWRHDSEDLEALHHNLDDVGVPRCDSAGTEYSAWGRVIQYAKAAAKAEARNE